MAKEVKDDLRACHFKVGFDAGDFNAKARPISATPN